MKHFLNIADFSTAELTALLDRASDLKARQKQSKTATANHHTGKSLALIFEQPSTRTRVSFEIAMKQLGGDIVLLDTQSSQIGRGETIADTARVLSRYVDAIMIRTNQDQRLHELSEYATVPVINGLTERSHPCQIMADLLTFQEHRGPITGKTIAWVGDANNVALSWAEASAKLDFTFKLAAPAERCFSPEVEKHLDNLGANLHLYEDPMECVAQADAVITDCWVSMHDGDPAEASKLHNIMAPYQVTRHVMAEAHPQAIFMHCLPAHRGEEVTADVIDGSQSVIFDEAENRLHAQKAILDWCLES